MAPKISDAFEFRTQKISDVFDYGQNFFIMKL